MNIYTLRALGTCVTMLLCSVAGARPAVVVNGGFEAPVISVPNAVVMVGNPALTGWVVTGTSGIDLVGSLWQPAQGWQSISLNWTSPSTITQTVTTTPGICYTLSYQIAAENPASSSVIRSLRARWNGAIVSEVVFNPAGYTNANMGWRFESAAVIGHGSDVLSFESTVAGAYGPALDNVQLTPSLALIDQPQTQSVCRAEPATVFVTATGTGSIAYQWQVLTAPGTWTDLPDGDLSLPCGGRIIASTPSARQTQIVVLACPGVATYLVRCVVSGSCGSITSDPAALTVCAPDFNCDGFLDFTDFDSFVTAFELGAPAADFNADGFIDFTDFDAFVIAFEAGC